MLSERIARLAAFTSLAVCGATGCNNSPYDPPPVPYVAKAIAGLSPRTTSPAFVVTQRAHEVCSVIGDVAFTMSTWNPYGVVLMQATIDLSSTSSGAVSLVRAASR